MRRAARLDSIYQDARRALRQLARAPGFTLVAVATLALGVGGTTAIFSAVYAVVLRPLPFREPDRLVRVYSTSPATTSSDEVSPRTFTVWRRDSRSFERIAPIETRSLTFAEGGGVAQRVTAVRTTADYFPMLGVRPLLGRTFLSEEDRPGRNRVAVLSHRFWVTRFGGDRGVVGRTVQMDAAPFTVIGVMPASFDVSAAQIDLWTPIALTAEDASVETGYLDVVARIRRGVTAAAAQADLSALARRIDEGRATEGAGARVVSYEADLVGAYRGRLLTLLGAVAFVLLIACTNVANLLLARGAGRSKELAIRGALGAGRGRIVRQLMVENLVLAAAGGTAGVALAFVALRTLKAAGPGSVPRLDQAGVDAASLVFALGAATLSALVFGLVPALRAAAPDLHAVLKQGGRSSAGAPSDRMRQALVAVEVALSLVLLVGAGLLIRSAMLLQRVEPGIEAANVWSGAVTLPAANYGTPERLAGTFERIVGAIAEIPGVESAATVSVAPFTGLRALGLFVPDGRPVDSRNTLMANLRHVSPGLFATLGIPVRQGRDFSDRDDAQSPQVVIVNEAFARLAWPGERALGKKLRGAGGMREVVGIVGDTREDGLREKRPPAVYFPIRQLSPSLWDAVQNSMFLVARTTVEPLSITRSVQEAVTRIDRGVPVFAVRSMEERMADMLAAARFNTGMLATLGVVGLLLAVVGIYGVIAYFVGQRRREIGVRMALGAHPGRVVALVVWEGMRPTLAGIVLGAVAAVGLTRVLASQLYGVAPTDPVTFMGVAAGLALAAALAAAIPARAAARVNPIEALGE